MLRPIQDCKNTPSVLLISKFTHVTLLQIYNSVRYPLVFRTQITKGLQHYILLVEMNS